MGNNKLLFAGVSLVLILGFVGVYLYGNNDATYANDEANKVEAEREKHPGKLMKDEHNSEVKDIKIDDLSQYKIENLTEEEVHQIFYAYEHDVNINIIFARQEGIQSETYDEEHRNGVGKFDREFAWIKENYNFGIDRHNDLFEVILSSIEKHKAGDNEALLSLKEAVYELNLDINPQFDQEKTAVDVTVEEAKKIINGETLDFVSRKN